MQIQFSIFDVCFLFHSFHSFQWDNNFHFLKFSWKLFHTNYVCGYFFVDLFLNLVIKKARQLKKNNFSVTALFIDFKYLLCLVVY